MAEGPTCAQWAALRSLKPVSDDAITTAPLCGTADGIVIGMDSAGCLHLLIPVNGGPTGLKPPDLNGLKVRHRQLTTGEVLDLEASPPHETVFNAVCQDVVTGIVDESREPWSAVASIIKKWQAAWKPARQEMDKTTQVGLFGELLILRHLMLPNLGSGAVHQWSGPDFERHDFVGDTLHFEVKTTRKSRHEHEVSRLDQLRVPAGCRLLLASIQLEESVGGNQTIAASLDAIIELLRSDGAAMDEFMTKMVHMGWSEEMRSSGEMLRFFIRDTAVFDVDADFPKLPDDFSPPSGVVAVRYTIDLANLPRLGMEEAEAIVQAMNAGRSV